MLVSVQVRENEREEEEGRVSVQVESCFFHQCLVPWHFVLLFYFSQILVISSLTRTYEHSQVI